jgi:hypothetical protein
MGKKVLGLDLSKVTMTDAIAAMVDAWLDEQELTISVHLDQEEKIHINSWSDWLKFHNIRGSQRQTALALCDVAGFSPEHVTAESVPALDALWKRILNGETLNGIRRSTGVVQRQANDLRMDQILQLRNQGKTYRQIADEMKISKSMVGYLCKLFDGAPVRNLLP